MSSNPNTQPNGNAKLDLALEDIIKSGHTKKDSRNFLASSHVERNGKWKHDMFARKRRNLQHRQGRHRGMEKKSATNWGYLVKISNLHWEFTKEDVKSFLETFQDSPPLGQISIIYDKSGRSEGICNIRVRSMEHAKRMVSLLLGKEINGIPISAAIENADFQEKPSGDSPPHGKDDVNKMEL